MIKQFAGVRQITNLEVYPLQYHPQKTEIHDKAVALGKKLIQMPPHSYHEIRGMALRQRPGGANPAASKKFYVRTTDLMQFRVVLMCFDRPWEG